MFKNMGKILNTTDEIMKDQLRSRSTLGTVIRTEMERFMGEVEERFHMLTVEMRAMKWTVETNISSLIKRYKEVIDMFRDENAKLKDQNISMHKAFNMMLAVLGKLS